MVEIVNLPLCWSTYEMNARAVAGRRAARIVGNLPDPPRRLGGWRTLGMVQRYSHLDPRHLQAAVEALAGSVGTAT
jgi:hypothetical protein